MNDWYSQFKRDLFWVLAITVALNSIRSCAGIGLDETDSPDQRSNLQLHTDYGTGCQYLSAQGGGLTPRLNESGRQVCR